MDLSNIGGFNHYKWAVSDLQSDYDLEGLSRMLGAIGKEVHYSGKTTKSAEGYGNQDYLDAIVDEECDVVELLLGVAAVVCQNQITHVVSKLKWLHNHSVLTSTNGSKPAIMRLGDSLLLGTPYSRVETIDAMANYFKHRDEWHFPWAQPDDRSKRTVEVIAAAGAQEHSSGNFRRVSSALGVNDYENLEPLHMILKDWRVNVARAYEVEFKASGYL